MQDKINKLQMKCQMWIYAVNESAKKNKEKGACPLFLLIDFLTSIILDAMILLNYRNKEG
jgi:hypothetical protein